MTPTEVTEKLGLLRMKDRTWYCHPSNALEGDGLFEGACGSLALRSQPCTALTSASHPANTLLLLWALYSTCLQA